MKEIKEENSGYVVFTESTNQLGNRVGVWRVALPRLYPRTPLYRRFFGEIFKDDVNAFSSTSCPGEAETLCTLYIKVIEQNERR